MLEPFTCREKYRNVVAQITTIGMLYSGVLDLLCSGERPAVVARYLSRRVSSAVLILGATSGKDAWAACSITLASFSSHVSITLASGVVIGASLISMALFTIEKADEFGSRYPRRLCHCAVDISICMSIRVIPYRKVKHKGK